MEVEVPIIAPLSVEAHQSLQINTTWRGSLEIKRSFDLLSFPRALMLHLIPKALILPYAHGAVFPRDPKLWYIFHSNTYKADGASSSFGVSLETPHSCLLKMPQQNPILSKRPYLTWKAVPPDLCYNEEPCFRTRYIRVYLPDQLRCTSKQAELESHAPELISLLLTHYIIKKVKSIISDTYILHYKV